MPCSRVRTRWRIAAKDPRSTRAQPIVVATAQRVALALEQLRGDTPEARQAFERAVALGDALVAQAPEAHDRAAQATSVRERTGACCKH